MECCSIIDVVFLTHVVTQYISLSDSYYKITVCVIISIVLYLLVISVAPAPNTDLDLDLARNTSPSLCPLYPPLSPLIPPPLSESKLNRLKDENYALRSLVQKEIHKHFYYYIVI